MKRNKDAGVATLLNVIVPGFGWFYCERIFIGIISLFINGVSFHILLSIRRSDEVYIVGILYICFWLFSVIYIFYNIKGFSLMSFLDGPIDTPIYKHKSIINNVHKNIVCNNCNHKFSVSKKGTYECPHCGRVNYVNGG